MKNKIIYIIVLILLSITLCINVINKSKASIFEKSYINSYENYTNFLEDLSTDNNEYDKYILYALDYNYNILNKNSLTTEEIKNFINDFFTIEITDENIKNTGITPLLLNNNITYNIEKDLFIIDKSNMTYSDIANIPIIKYELNKIKKSGKKLIVTYNKYIVTNPYDIYNYYSSLENNNIDVNKLNNYLKGTDKITVMKDAITSDYIKNNNLKLEGNIKVEYIIENGKLKINNIK